MEILAFIKNNTFSKLYLVGDIIDIEAMKSKRYWPQSHNDVVQKILRLARKGVQVVYVFGNHDIFVSSLLTEDSMSFGNVTLLEKDIHVAADGTRCLVMHGHQLDGTYAMMKWLYFLGDKAYTMALTINKAANAIGRRLGLPYFSISSWLKRRVKNAVSYMTGMENGIARYAEDSGIDCVICGHLHHPQDRMIGGVRYMNCGDFVESCTCIVEAFDGKLSVVESTGNWYPEQDLNLHVKDTRA